MAEFCSEDWLELRERLAATGDRPAGGSGVFAVTVSGGPGGDRKWVETVDGGLPVEHADEGDAPTQLRVTWDDAAAIARGELSPAAAFMQGRLKVDGDMGPMLGVLEVAGDPAVEAHRRAVDAETTYPS